MAESLDQHERFEMADSGDDSTEQAGLPVQRNEIPEHDPSLIHLHNLQS